MIKTELKFLELKKLIELCGNNGVTEFSLGDFKVVFGGQTKDTPLTTSRNQTKVDEVQSQVVEKEALAQASQDMDDEDLAVMQVVDPSRYEQLMIERELEDDGSDAGITGYEQSIADKHLGAQASHDH